MVRLSDLEPDTSYLHLRKSLLCLTCLDKFEVIALWAFDPLITRSIELGPA